MNCNYKTTSQKKRSLTAKDIDRRHLHQLAASRLPEAGGGAIV
ncbi:hypothetical protein [Nostoc sp.]